MSELTMAEISRHLEALDRRALDYVRLDLYDRDMREIRDDIKDIRTSLDKAAESQKNTSRALLVTAATSALTFLTMLLFFILERVSVSG